MKRVGLIPLKRLEYIPETHRLKHEFCFFLHDECVRALKEYEGTDAHFVNVEFKRETDADRFAEIANDDDVIEALQSLGYDIEAKKIVLNNITIAMISDCLHHVYEALRCLEKRKFIVALNLLRKPLKDSLTYLTWMCGDPDEFYAEFMKGNPHDLSHMKLGNVRKDIFSGTIRKLDIGHIFDAESLIHMIFNRENPHGLEGYFQHAVHLVTIKYDVTRTSPQNFNFIFQDPLDDDIYDIIYGCLPYVICFLAHVVIELFDEMKSMDEGAKEAFKIRSILGISLIEGFGCSDSIRILRDAFENRVSCPNCCSDLKITHYNATKILLTDTYRCTNCRRNHDFPFSYLF